MEMVGQWIRPWPGENVFLYACFISEDVLRCRATDGQWFDLRLEDLGKAEVFGSQRPPIVNCTIPKDRPS